MKLSSVTGAYSSIVNGLIRDCETTNAFETLSSIEDKYEAVQAMFVSIMTECTEADVVKMRSLKNTLFEAFERARKDAWARIAKA